MRVRSLLWGAPVVLTVLAAAACSDDEVTPPGGVTPTPEAGTGTETGTQPPGPDGSTPTDSGTDAPVNGEVKPVILALSATGHDRFFGIAYDTTGNLYASGVLTTTTDAAEDVISVVAKITPAGALDTTFGDKGVAKVNLAVGGTEQPRGVIVQSNGKIVIAATVFHPGTVAADRDVAVARFTATGAIDTTFGTGGTGIVTKSLSEPDVGGSIFDSQWGLALGPANSIIVEGAAKSPTASDSDFAIWKLTAEGADDTTFGGTGVVFVDVGGGRDASARNVYVAPTGHVFATGYMRDGTTSTDPVNPVIIKIKPDGALDDTFAVGGIYNEQVLPLVTEVYGVVPQTVGGVTSLVTTGYGRANETESVDWLSLRIGATGVRDTTFGTAGIARFDLAGQTDNARNIVALPDGRFAVIGGGRKTATEQDAVIAIFSANGAPDTTFGPKGIKSFEIGGPSDHFWGASVSPDGKTLAIGGLTGGKDGGNDDAVVYLMPLAK